MADGVVVVDPAGVVRYANSAAHRLFGHDRDEGMLGSLFGVPVMASGVAEIELIAGASLRLIELNAARIQWGNGPAWLLALRDVTARKQREMSVFRKGQEFEELAYTVSHDLQAPLRTIEQLAQSYLEDYGADASSQAGGLVEMMREVASRGREMVGALMDYAALGADADTKIPCDLTRVLDDVRANLRSRIEQTQAVLMVDPRLPTVLANPTYMVQLLQNLVENSLKFAGAGVPQITIAATKRAVDWRIDVVDKGIGIPEDQADYVFGVFAQLARSDAAIEGRGIGLAACKKIVEYHGGAIWVDTTCVRGCKMSFTIPIE